MLYSIQDTAAAVENILLAAVDRGLASCWVGAFDDDAVRDAIGVHEPDHAHRGAAGRALGRGGRQAGATAARGGHDVAVGPGRLPGSAVACATTSATVIAARSGYTRTILVFGDGDPHVGADVHRRGARAERGPAGRAVRRRGRAAAGRAAGLDRARPVEGLHHQPGEVPPAGQPRSAARSRSRRARPFLDRQIELIVAEGHRDARQVRDAARAGDDGGDNEAARQALSCRRAQGRAGPASGRGAATTASNRQLLFDDFKRLRAVLDRDRGGRARRRQPGRRTGGAGRQKAPRRR